METTYFGRGFGVMVLMDSISQQVLFVREANHEINPLYAEAKIKVDERNVPHSVKGRKGEQKGNALTV